MLTSLALGLATFVTSDLGEDIIYMAALILIPIIPAFLLFKGLPSTAETSGLLQGLQIKLGGAFAGYFILLLVISKLVPPPAHLKNYEIRGRLVLDADSSTDPLLWKDRIQLTVKPKTADIEDDGTFWIRFPYNPDSKEHQQPNIVVSGGKCGSAQFTIPGPDQTTKYGAARYTLDYDLERRVITVKEPVRLRNPTPAALDTARLVCTANQFARN